MSKIDFSFVIPMYNEEGNVQELFDKLLLATGKLKYSFEIIFVNDGSSDSTQQKLEGLLKGSKIPLKIIEFHNNFKKAAAYMAGFAKAEGKYIITMDGDLQDDPFEIDKFIAKANEGYDFVSGWKVNDKGKSIKPIYSRIFNSVISRTFHLPIHDIDCPFRCIRRDIAEKLNLYEGNYRFIPLLAFEMGARIYEVPIKNLPRTWGKSKYSHSKLKEGLFDYISHVFLMKYRKKPMHFFGTLGILSFLIGVIILIYLTILWLSGVRPIGNRPLFFLGLLLFITGTQLFSTGFIADSLMFHNKDKKDSNYIIRSYKSNS
ncbi:glycosyltransferase family 2 protein [bacterium]|nr:glycosyltransferase family 2 protein [bacterium]